MSNALTLVRNLKLLECKACSERDQLPPYVRLSELLTMVPFSASTVWRKSKNGTFVAPVVLSDRITCWSRQAVVEWLKSREAA